MNKQFQVISLLATLVFLHAPAGFAQDDEATTTQAPGADVEETTPDSEEVPAGQEVEINEDNYRQFMELKDARQQRDMLPENSYQSQAGAQKIDKLPEESQKHLRNELREIIIQGDEWQPGDEETDYPYVPSKTASTNQALQKQEADAWGELVDNYHKREAEIYGNASRSKAASTGAAGEGSGEGEGSAGGNMGQGREGQQASQQNNSKQSSTAGSYSPDSSSDPNATSTEGVSQNAMEFLKGQGNQVANAGEANTASSEDNNGQADAQADRQADAQTDGQANAQAGQQADGQEQAGQQSTDEQNRTASASSSESIVPPSSDQSESESTAGASQNALEYLTGGNDRTGQEGTLTIEDLMNAQGVRNAAGAGSPSSNVRDDDEDPDKTPPDNGGSP